MCALLAVLITPFIKTLLGRSVWSLASLLGLMLLLFAVDEIKVEFLRIYNYQLVIWSMFGIAVAAQRLPGRAAISRAAPAARIGPDAGRLL
jgi:uncharacterized membrane protein